jgi:hypothetical protein
MLPHWTTGVLESLRKDNGFGLAIALGSGALGFLFSTIHHLLHWHGPRELHPGVDYRPLIGRLRVAGVLEVLEARTNIAVTSDVPRTRQEAWTIVTALWHERVTNQNKGIGAANPRADSLANLVHSVGAATVATAMALLTALIIAGHVAFVSRDWDPVMRFAATILIALLLFWLHEKSYRDTLNISQSFVEQVLTDTLSEETAKNGPVRTHIVLPNAVGRFTPPPLP